MAENKVNRESVRWLALEGTAIVISILLAFSIQAWWDERQQRDEEGTVLQSLLDDFIEKKSMLMDVQISAEARLESATKLLRATTDENQNLPQETIDRLLGDIMFYNPESLWDSAPMNSLVMGGGIPLISNAELLQMLASLQVSISWLRSNLRLLETFYHNSLMPFITKNANLTQINMAIEHQAGHPEWDFVFPEVKISIRRDHTELLSMTEFQGLLNLRIDREVDILNTIRSRRFDEQLDKTIALLEEELAK